MSKHRNYPLWLLVIVAAFTMVAASCSSSGVSQEDYDQAIAQLDAKTQELATAQSDLATAEENITALQDQMGDTSAHTIIQATTDDPQVGPSPSGWETEASLAANVQLLGTYDSSGPDAWDASAHPDVFVTSEGIGYAGFESEVYNKAGLQIIDAHTHEHVASVGFDLGYERMGTPHGLGVSPDGRWIYVPTADGSQPWQLNSVGGGRLIVVDARTLMIHQILGMDNGPHHVKAFTTPEGDDRVIVETQGGPTLLLDPNDDNRVVMQVGPDRTYGQAYQVDADLMGENLYMDLVLGGRGIAPQLQGAVAKINLESGRITYIAGVGMYPNGFAFTSDGLWTYVADSSGDRVYKIDNTTDTVVGSTQAAVPGPYMIELNEDETELWVIGKGEMTYNLGGSLGLIDLNTFRAVRDYPIGGQTIDHDITNPFATNELWVTSSGTAETIVFDMPTREVLARIPDANGGDTHSGAFVHYNPDWTGELVCDNGGARGAYLQQKLEMVAARPGSA